MNDVEEIKNKLDIVEIIGDYVPLKKAGSNYKGISPFKAEKTPSFMVSSEKNIWHDFSSGQGGDVFSFIMQIEGIEFREALEMLAKRAGVTLKARPKDKSNTQSNTKLYDALEMSMKFYHLQLSKNKKALQYLTDERGLKVETIKRFKLGYSPDSWNELRDFLLGKGYSTSTLISAGVIKQKSGSESTYDAFRDRIMFPIFDSQKRVVGFSARVLTNSKDTAKYINSAESQIYHKSSILYGLMQAREAIRKKDEVILVEGNMDVVALSNYGYENVVASSGTALSTEQLKTLSRITNNIKLCFDQDEAGVAATERTIELSSELDIKLMVVSYSGAKDPDELIKKDKKAWENALTSAKYIVDYIFDTQLKKNDIKTAIGKKQFAKNVLPIVAKIQDNVEKEHYIKKLAQAIDTPENILRDRLQKDFKSKVDKSEEPQIASVQSDNISQPKRKLSKSEKIEQLILELMLSSTDYREALSDIDISNTSSLHRPIFEQLLSNPGANANTIAKSLPKYSNYVKILSLRGEHVYSDSSEHDARLEAYTQIHRLNKIEREKTKRQLTREIATAEAEKNATKVKKLLKEYQALLNEE